MNVLDTVAPIKEVRLKNRSEPWMLAEILDLIKTETRFCIVFKNIMYRNILNFTVN